MGDICMGYISPAEGFYHLKEGIDELEKITGRELLRFEFGAKHFAVLLGEGL